MPIFLHLLFCLPVVGIDGSAAADDDDDDDDNLVDFLILLIKNIMTPDTF